ncbi:TIGR03086 family metal-binding protein [Embleya hyalina]|uniref:TIGR03086 family protein n=1 Tax=Embleya hyalina TaxID=516124 RepID=A0A401YQK0_9ACTN|nr:TIGR03086 family metal-binding protein [Embleya hyalina]GCD96888.1 TIGR03086 family protein [Embleya hyalina]
MHTKLERIRELDARAVRYSVELVGQAASTDLDRPTPCAGWTLADLLGHMTAQHRGFGKAAAGDGGDRTHWAIAPLGTDPAATYRESADALIAAFAEVAGEEVEFDLPEFGVDRGFPAVEAIGFHFIDYLVHGWDVARALGVPFEPEADLVTAGLPIALAVPDTDHRLRPGAAFAPSLDGWDRTRALDRILLYLGRSPRWPATTG